MRLLHRLKHNFYGLPQWLQIVSVVVISAFVVAILARIEFVQKERLAIQQAHDADQTKMLTRATDYTAHFTEIQQRATANPNDKTALTDLALAYYNTQDYTNAIATYEKILKIDPTDTLAYNGLGNVHRDVAIATPDPTIRQHEFVQAENYYQQAIKIDKSYILAYTNLAQMLSLYIDKALASNVIEQGIQATNNQSLKQLQSVVSQQ